jgi:bacteriocin-like protein
MDLRKGKPNHNDIRELTIEELDAVTGGSSTTGGSARNDADQALLNVVREMNGDRITVLVAAGIIKV